MDNEINSKATAMAYSNIALIKYWGDNDPVNHLPANGSISFNLDGLHSQTSVTWTDETSLDNILLNGKIPDEGSHKRISNFIVLIRKMTGRKSGAIVVSENNFPSSTGIASSASGFAALALAATKAAGMNLSEKDLSRLARKGSGSAARSIPAGFVEWHMGSNDQDSFAETLAPPDHWDLCDLVVIFSAEKKEKSSLEGHNLAQTSPLQKQRVQEAPKRLELCRKSIIEKDFDGLTAVIEMDSDLMHSVMLSSTPPLPYRSEKTLELMQAIRSWRKEGLQVCYTVDAGPNVHIIHPGSVYQKLLEKIKSFPGTLRNIENHPGLGAHLIENDTSSGL